MMKVTARLLKAMKQRSHDTIDVMPEVSDPDFWMEVRHFDEDPLVHDEADGGNPVGFGRHYPNCEDWHMNHEIA